MSIRRMMLFTLGGFFKSIIALFKTRVLSDGGTFEAETNLENQLNTLGSDLFNSASLVITPNGVKTSKFYSIKPNDGTGDLTVVRNTSATRIDSNGNIVDVSANVARIDYTTGSPAILVEPQRTNLVYPSDIATTQVRAVTAQVYTLSFYATGTVTLSGAFSGSLVGTGTNNKVSLTFTPTAGNLTLTVSGSVTNWQLEAGSNATSLIKTVSGSVTRNGDLISKAGISSLIGQTEGSIFVEFNLSTVGTSIGSGIIELTPAGGYEGENNRILIWKNISNKQIAFQIRAGGSTNIFNRIFSAPANGLVKVAIGYKSGNSFVCINGSGFSQSETFAFTQTLNFIKLGVYSSQNVIINDSINSALIFKTRLDNATLQNLTTL